MDRPHRSVRQAALALWALAGLAGCQEEPSLLCDRARIVWPFFDITPAVDTSPDEGIQMDLALRTSLRPGTEVSLSVRAADSEPVPHPEPAVADETGDLLFTDVGVPYGRIALEVTARSECGDVRSVRTPFVWDGLGMPMCEIDIGVDPIQVEELAPLSVLRGEQDADPEEPGLQLDVTVTAGRPDMTVTLFALDPVTGEQAIFSDQSGDDLAASFPVTLGEGERSLRAVCVWEPSGLRPSSPTFRYLVDTVAPDCELVLPASRVRQVDDLDPEVGGVQFALLGRTAAADAVGQPAAFTLDGVEVTGSAIDDGGESGATGTLAVAPGVSQEIGFRVADAAGNACEDVVSFP
jgi:hypothetical protein